MATPTPLEADLPPVSPAMHSRYASAPRMGGERMNTNDGPYASNRSLTSLDLASNDLVGNRRETFGVRSFSFSAVLMPNSSLLTSSSTIWEKWAPGGALA